jgi:WD40 repeat protein
VESLSFSPDGRILGAGNHEEGQVLFYDVASWKPLAVLQPLVGTRVSSIAFSADGQYFAAAGSNGLTLWRVVRNGGTISFQPVGPPLSDVFSASICISRDGNWLAWVEGNWGRDPHVIHVWDLRRSQLQASSMSKIRYGMEIPNVIGFCPNSNQLVFVSGKSAIAVSDIITKQEIHSLGKGELKRRGINYPSTHLSADGAWYALGDRAVTVWDLKAKKLLVALSVGNRVRSIGWSPDQELLAVGDSDGGLEIWNLPKINARLAEIGLGW